MGHRLSKSNRTSLSSPRNQNTIFDDTSLPSAYLTAATTTTTSALNNLPSTAAINIIPLSQDSNDLEQTFPLSLATVAGQDLRIEAATITVPANSTSSSSSNSLSPVASTSSSSASSPNQVIIRIQLTKMETENNNNFDTLENSSNSNTTGNQIINLTISNNFVCDAAATSNTTTTSPLSSLSPVLLSNNLNFVNSSSDNSDSGNSNTIPTHCLNIIEASNFRRPVENDLNRANSKIVNPSKMNVTVTAHNNNDENNDYDDADDDNNDENGNMNNLATNFSTTYNIPISNSNIQPVMATTAMTTLSTMPTSACCVNSSTENLTAADNYNGNITANVPMSHSNSSSGMSSSNNNGSVVGSCKTKNCECNSGQSSLCAESGGDRHHCCRPKKKLLYPSKLRCCQCVRRESRNGKNTTANSSTSSKNCSTNSSGSSNRSYRFCRGNSSTTSSSTDRQSPADTPPSVQQSTCAAAQQQRAAIQALNSHRPNVIFLSVNVPSHIIENPIISPFGELDWLLRVNPDTIRRTPPTSTITGTSVGPMVHSQTDYSHCLVPGLEKITNSSFYWGKMDRYEAERLLEGKPEGTFLLRDSAQDEYLFSVTFRKYGRTLHARIEQLGHKFSFDCHDPCVYTASTVTGLLEHYKDPSCVMFFEPMLTIPLHRNFSFSLQQLCRATIVSHIKYDGINELQLPNTLKSYLKEYHYKYKVRETPLDDSLFHYP